MGHKMAVSLFVLCGLLVVGACRPFVSPATPNSALPTATAELPTATAEPPAATPIPTTTLEPLTAVELGKQVFNTRFLETSGRHCGYCHHVSESESEKISLINIASRAGERVEGMSAEEYIRQSILDPRAFLVEGQPPEGMPLIFAEILSEEDVNNLVAYLMTLKAAE